MSNELFYNLSGSVACMGLPISGTTVRLFDYRFDGEGVVRHFVQEKMTAAKGDFTFEVKTGVYSVEIIPVEHSRFSRQSFEPVLVTGNINLNVILRSGSILSGTVYGSEKRKLAACEVTAIGPYPQIARAMQITDADGRFALSLTEGKYHLAVRGGSFLSPEFHQIELFADKDLDLILPEPASFQGDVTDQDGAPVANAQLRIKSLAEQEKFLTRELPMFVNCNTDEQGLFSCLLSPGSYSVSISPPAGASLSEKLAGQTTVQADCRRSYVLLPGCLLSGQIFWRGTPVAGALITVFGAELESSRVTAADGSYSFSLAPGDYQYSVVVQPDALGLMSGGQPAPAVGSYQLKQDGRFDLELQEGISLCVKVYGPAKRPRPEVSLAIFATKNGTFDGLALCSRPIVSGLTGADGDYRTRLLPGKYWLVLNNQFSTGRLIQISGENEEEILNVDNICLLNFDVTSDNDDPVPGCQITFEAYAKNGEENDLFEALSFPLFTDKSGQCHLTLSSGIYSFHLEPNENSPYAPRDIRQLSVMADLNRRVRLTLKA
ncbi:MAG: carboxypeptidase-like regulatory domain-containing protein [Candidatus Obscuribacterales bacterium]|nr:carboxypeptidase-like regulatory domain-containing protein [Candidatus Obscuribacterales bacterium]